MRVRFLRGVYLRGECFDPAEDAGREVAAQGVVSLHAGWAHLFIAEGRAVPDDGEVVPPAPALTTQSIAIDTRDPVSSKKGKR